MTDSGPPDVSAHIPGLRRYARALIRDDAAADDLVQDTLVRAIERAGTYRSGGSLRAWLAGILFRQFVDARRRIAAEARRNATLGTIDAAEAHEASQEHAAELAKLAERFHRLPEHQRAVLHLVAVEGLSYAETAAALDLPIGTVMSRLSRARATLRDPASAGDTVVPFSIVRTRP